MQAPPALFVGSFPPRRCGIATFTRDLVSSYSIVSASRSEVVAIDDRSGREYAYGGEVVARLREDDLASYYSAARFINAHLAGVVNVQHEYGLFGGPGGLWASELFDATIKPIVLTLHTVLTHPPKEHLRLARRLLDRAARAVVLSQNARGLLVDLYDADPHRIEVIPHGVPDVPLGQSGSFKRTLGLGDRLVIATFGLLSSGKGVEYAVEALREVVREHPDALYLLIGATHPNVVAAEGERYRDKLNERIAALGLQRNVRMIDRYLTLEELIAYLQATDVYVTPSLNPDQVVSGTLAYALAAGKAIVSTPYLYARELLADGRGRLAEFRDAGSLASGILAFLNDTRLRTRTEIAAHRFGRTMTWPHVAGGYAKLFAEIARSSAPALAAS